MTKKDYELIAETIRKFADEEKYIMASRILVSRLSSAFMTDNPRFDPERFTKACGF